MCLSSSEPQWQWLGAPSTRTGSELQARAQDRRFLPTPASDRGAGHLQSPFQSMSRSGNDQGGDDKSSWICVKQILVCTCTWVCFRTQAGACGCAASNCGGADGWMKRDKDDCSLLRKSSEVAPTASPTARLETSNTVKATAE